MCNDRKGGYIFYMALTGLFGLYILFLFGVVCRGLGMGQLTYDCNESF
jgi:hypothetical protein